MKKRNAPAAYLPAVLGGVSASILGASVLIGWATHNVALIQVSAAFAPMQFNTALGFVVCGLGLVVITTGQRGVGTACGLFVMLLGLLTLAEYILGIDLAIDELLLKHYISVQTSHPGRMAPNTALCFSLTGAALAVFGTVAKAWKPAMIASVLGSLTAGLGIVALVGYTAGFEAAYGWGGFTRMAVHTASGFTIIGVAVVSLAWQRTVSGPSQLPAWLPVPVGLCVLSITISLWQALDSADAQLMRKNGTSEGHSFFNDAFLVVGIVLAAALCLAVYFAQAAGRRARQRQAGSLKLAAEIDERMRAESALWESEDRFRGLFENSDISVWNEDLSKVCKALDKLRLDGVSDLRRYLESNQQAALDIAAMVEVLHVNEATLRLFDAKSADEFLYRIDKIFGSGALEVFIDELCAIWDKQRRFRSEAAFRTLDGRDIDAIISFRIPETEGGFQSIPVSIIDITERKHVEDEREKLLHDKGERIKELQCIYAVAESIRTRSTLEAILLDVAELIPPGWHYPEITRAKVKFDGKEYVSEPFVETEWKLSRDIIVNGESRGSIEVYYLEECPEQDEGPFMREERALINGMAENISEAVARRLAEEQRDKVNRLYATLIQINQAIVRERDQQKLFQKISDIAIEFGKFRLAWIGLVDEENEVVKLAAVSGEDSDCLQDIETTLGDGLTARGPTGRAIIEGTGVVFNDLVNNLDFAPWREQALEMGYRSSGAFPIRLNNIVIGSLNVCAVDPHFFDEAEIKLLEEAALDLSYALDNLEDEAKRRQHEELTALQARRADALLDLPQAAEQLDEMAFIQHGLELAEDLTASLISFIHFVNDEDTIELVAWSRRTLEYYCHAIHDKHYPIREAGIWADAVRRKRSLVFNDYDGHSHKHGLPEGHSELKRLISVPVIEDGKVVMVAGVGNKGSDFTDLDVETVRLLSNEIWRIVQRRRAVDKIARFSRVLERSLNEIYIFDSETLRFVDVNLGARINLGYSMEELQSLTPLELKPNFTAESFAALIEPLRSGAEQEIVFTTDHRRKNGTLYPVEVHLERVDGETPVFVALIQDITERMQTEKALRVTQKMDAVGQLTGGIAHDFNNILGIILGNLHLLEGQIVADEKILKRIKTIKDSTQRAAKLTKQLLGFSRRQATEVMVTDLNRVIGGMQSLIDVSVTPEVEVEHHIAEDLGLTEIDPGEFEDALLNLIFNARDAMPNGGRLIIETRNCTFDVGYCKQNPGAKPGEYVQLAVSDSGEGIQAEQQEHVFEPFFTTKAEGTGLGLATVFGFVKRSGGYIEVHSDPVIGTTFQLYLPRTQEQAQPLEAVEDRAEVQPCGGETLLAVDDEIELLKLAQESLQALGYRVLTACDGRQALERLAEEPGIALLFSDVVMPGGMNGYELAERATARRPDLKVLLTSGHTEKAIANRSQICFTAGLLRKPYTLAELARQIRTLLDDSETAGLGQAETKSGGEDPS